MAKRRATLSDDIEIASIYPAIASPRQEHPRRRDPSERHGRAPERRPAVRISVAGQLRLPQSCQTAARNGGARRRLRRQIRREHAESEFTAEGRAPGRSEHGQDVWRCSGTRTDSRCRAGFPACAPGGGGRIAAEDVPDSDESRIKRYPRINDCRRITRYPPPRQQ